MSQHSICLIGGTGRSGTTILKRIFSEHPSVVAAPESRFSIDPDGLLDFYDAFSRGWSPYLLDNRVKKLRRTLRALGHSSALVRATAHVLGKLGLRAALPFSVTPRYAGNTLAKSCPSFLRHVDGLIGELVEFSYDGTWNGIGFFEPTKLSYAAPLEQRQLADVLGAFWRRVIVDTCASHDARYYVEDNTWNILWFDRILELLPDARLVHIYRDPRDVVTSFMSMDWAPSDVLLAARWYQGVIRRWFAVREHLPAASYLEISLEGLVADPRSVLQDLCGFWDIEWHDALLDTKLDKAHSGRWRKELNSEDQRQLSEALRPEVELLGYPLDLALS